MYYLVGISKLARELMQLGCYKRSRQNDDFHRDLNYDIQTSKTHDNYGARDKDFVRSRCGARIVSYMLWVPLFRKV
jgi:hypothetical protein